MPPAADRPRMAAGGRGGFTPAAARPYSPECSSSRSASPGSAGPGVVEERPAHREQPALGDEEVTVPIDPDPAQGRIPRDRGARILPTDRQPQRRASHTARTRRTNRWPQCSPHRRAGPVQPLPRRIRHTARTRSAGGPPGGGPDQLHLCAVLSVPAGRSTPEGPVRPAHALDRSVDPCPMMRLPGTASSVGAHAACTQPDVQRHENDSENDSDCQRTIVRSTDGRVGREPVAVT